MIMVVVDPYERELMDRHVAYAKRERLVQAKVSQVYNLGTLLHLHPRVLVCKHTLFPQHAVQQWLQHHPEHVVVALWASVPRPDEVRVLVRAHPQIVRCAVYEDLRDPTFWEPLEARYEVRDVVEHTLAPILAERDTWHPEAREVLTLLLQHTHYATVRQVAAHRYAGADPAHEFRRRCEAAGHLAPKRLLLLAQLLVWYGLIRAGVSETVAARAVGRDQPTSWRRTVRHELGVHYAAFRAATVPTEVVTAAVKHAFAPHAYTTPDVSLGEQLFGLGV